MRKDPPFNTEYIYATYILERAELQGAMVANRPQGLRDMNEKVYTAWFPECCATTLITRDMGRHARLPARPRARARSPDGVWGSLCDVERSDLEAKARDCAALFQRSSSCVEGRNEQLSLRHHGLHRLTSRKLQALGVLHNYLTKRPDGTTAAERFFGARPQPLMPWLLSRLPLPAHPRRGDTQT